LAVALLGIVGLLVRLEMRATVQANELKALRADVTEALRDRGSTNGAPGAAMPPFVVQGQGIGSDTIQAIAGAVVQLQAQRAAASAAAVKGDAPPLRSVEQEKATAHAGDVVAQAIARGRLSTDDVIRMRQDLAAGQATEAERDALRSEIAVAINAQKLVPEDPRFVYP
jgi:hypothetical protein